MTPEMQAVMSGFFDEMSKLAEGEESFLDRHGHHVGTAAQGAIAGGFFGHELGGTRGAALGATLGGLYGGGATELMTRAHRNAILSANDDELLKSREKLQNLPRNNAILGTLGGAGLGYGYGKGSPVAAGIGATIGGLTGYAVGRGTRAQNTKNIDNLLASRAEEGEH
jgi:uncharacterized protein YcfJ